MRAGAKGVTGGWIGGGRGPIGDVFVDEGGSSLMKYYGWSK